MPSRDKIYLVGFMGSGKTTIGKKLAGLLGWTFTDLDKKIEQKTGKTIPSIFSEHGEAHFRRVESEVLRESSTIRGVVISTGGGAPCHDKNMDFMLSNGLTVYLRLTPYQLSSRLAGSGTERPLIKGLEKKELLTFIETKLSERQDFYNSAELIVDGFDPDMKDLLGRIRNML